MALQRHGCRAYDRRGFYPLVNPEGLGMERRLSAILAADVVGYGRLMERDEAFALSSLGHCVR